MFNKNTINIDDFTNPEKMKELKNENIPNNETMKMKQKLKYNDIRTFLIDNKKILSKISFWLIILLITYFIIQKSLIAKTLSLVPKAEAINGENTNIIYENNKLTKVLKKEKKEYTNIVENNTVIINDKVISQSVFKGRENLLKDFYIKNKENLEKTEKGYVYTPIKVLLSSRKYIQTKDITVYSSFGEKMKVIYKDENDKEVILDTKDISIQINNENEGVSIKTESGYIKTNAIYIIAKDDETPLIIKGYNNTKTFGNKTFVDNKFVGALLIRNYKGIFQIVNELDIEKYIEGIAETVGNTHIEKMKVMSIIARSYALHYATQTEDKKSVLNIGYFTATDDPANFQKYLGANYTERNEKRKNVVKETKGLVLFHKDDILKTVYSSCTKKSIGHRLTPKEAGWNSDYFRKVKDVYVGVEDKIGINKNTEDKYCGNNVGLSGYGAEKLAEKGENYKSIINYYYKNVSIKNHINKL